MPHFSHDGAPNLVRDVQGAHTRKGGILEYSPLIVIGLAGIATLIARDREEVREKKAK